MEKVERAYGGCWVWTAYVGANGYGRFYLDGRGALAHRWSYMHHRGPIHDGLVIDHLCRNKACVNPDHLEPVTPSENVRRGVGPQATREMRAAMPNCPNGHPYDEDSQPDSGGRRCQTCRKAGRQASYQRNREAVIQRAAEWRAANPERARQVGRESQRRHRARKKEQAA